MAAVSSATQLTTTPPITDPTVQVSLESQVSVVAQEALASIAPVATVPPMAIETNETRTAKMIHDAQLELTDIVDHLKAKIFEGNAISIDEFISSKDQLASTESLKHNGIIANLRCELSGMLDRVMVLSPEEDMIQRLDIRCSMCMAFNTKAIAKAREFLKAIPVDLRANPKIQAKIEELKLIITLREQIELSKDTASQISLENSQWAINLRIQNAALIRSIENPSPPEFPRVRELINKLEGINRDIRDKCAVLTPKEPKVPTPPLFAIPKQESEVQVLEASLTPILMDGAMDNVAQSIFETNLISDVDRQFPSSGIRAHLEEPHRELQLRILRERDRVPRPVPAHENQ